MAIFDELNLEYSKALWMLCAGFQIPLLYASSAATYGLGEHGYSDDHTLIPLLKPLNPYGQSKQDFDVWVLETIAKGDMAPPQWAGFKFFNVYGPNEYHKGRMASVIFHTCRKIKSTGAMQLFRSHRPDFKDGEQSRDFIYVKDLTDVLLFSSKNIRLTRFTTSVPVARTFSPGNRHFPGHATGTEYFIHRRPRRIRDTYQYLRKRMYANCAAPIRPRSGGGNDAAVFAGGDILPGRQRATNNLVYGALAFFCCTA